MMVVSIGSMRMAMRQFFGCCRANIKNIALKMQLLACHRVVKVNDHGIFCYRYYLPLETVAMVILQWQHAAYSRHILALEHFLW
jgi:hypothetical protein